MPSQGEDVTFGTEGAGIGKHGYNEQVESKLAADKYAGWFDKKSEGQGGEYGDIENRWRYRLFQHLQNQERAAEEAYQAQLTGDISMAPMQGRMGLTAAERQVGQLSASDPTSALAQRGAAYAIAQAGGKVATDAAKVRAMEMAQARQAKLNQIGQYTDAELGVLKRGTGERGGRMDEFSANALRSQNQMLGDAQNMVNYYGMAAGAIGAGAGQYAGSEPQQAPAQQAQPAQQQVTYQSLNTGYTSDDRLKQSVSRSRYGY